jgi:multidrug efflux pump subunit AcrB
VFLGNVRAMLISVVSIPISFAGTFVVMRALGYSLDTISLLGLTLAVAFVVDDAIVMVENIVRLQHAGYRMMAATLTGARQITFTIASITLSRVAAFAPFFLISGIIGALFREFAVTLCTAIVISAIVSLTLTPALCARFLHRRVEGPLRFLDRFSQRLSVALNAGYVSALQGALRHQQAVLVLTIVITALTMVLFGTVRRGFLPTQESGVIAGAAKAHPTLRLPQ